MSADETREGILSSLVTHSKNVNQLRLQLNYGVHLICTGQVYNYFLRINCNGRWAQKFASTRRIGKVPSQYRQETISELTESECRPCTRYLSMYQEKVIIPWREYDQQIIGVIRKCDMQTPLHDMRDHF
jgi:hypothetical protein